MVAQSFGVGNFHLWLYSCPLLKPGNTLNMEVYGERKAEQRFIYTKLLCRPKYFQ